MSTDAQQLLEATLKAFSLDDGFVPADIGHKLGFPRHRSDAAARELADNGVFEMNFDGAAQFTGDFRKSRAKAPVKAARAPAKKSKRPAATKR